jgi:hypothetical protein
MWQLGATLRLAIALSLLIAFAAQARWVSRTATGTADFVGGNDCGKQKTEFAVTPFDAYGTSWAVRSPTVGAAVDDDSGVPVATVETAKADSFGDIAITIRVGGAACDPNSTQSQSWAASLDAVVAYRTIAFTRCRHISGTFGGASIGVHGGATCSTGRQVVRVYIARVIRTRRTAHRVSSYRCDQVDSAGEVVTVDCWRGGKLIHFAWGV